MKIFQHSIVATLVAALLTACGGSDSEAPTPEQPIVINKPPTLSVSNATVREKASVNLVASATDADGTISSYAWVQKSGIGVMLVGQTSSTVNFVAPVVTADEKLVFTVTVTDNLGTAASQDVEVTILNNRLPAITVAGASLKEGEIGNINAQVTDSDGTISQLAWTQKSGPAATISGTASNTLTVKAPIVTADQELVFTLVATDSDGESSSSDVKVNVLANMLSFTVKGKVTDKPVADAKVTVEVAEHRFAVVADGRGDYSALINVDDSFADKLVQITAVGPEANSKTKLISVLGDVASLLESAGNDKVLTKDEVFGVNVTNMTTASHALMRMVNGGGEITTKAAFDTAQKSYDASMLMPLATAIKLVLDYSAKYPELGLPAGVTDVAALVADLSRVRLYLESATSAQPVIHKDAQLTIINDPDVFAAGLAIPKMIGTYYVVPKEGNSSSDRMSFAADGSGETIGSFRASAFSWRETSEGTWVTYPGKGLYQGDDWEQVSGIGNSVKFDRYRNSSLIKWVHNSDKSAQLLVKHFNTKSYLDVGMPDVTEESDFVGVVAVKTAGLAGVEAVDKLLQLGTTYSLSIPTNEINISNAHPSADKTYLSAISLTLAQGNKATLTEKRYAGDGSDSDIAIPASYTLTDAGLLKIQPSGTDKPAFDVAILTTELPILVNVQSYDPGGNRARGGYLLPKGLAKWDASKLAGIYDLGWNFFSPLQYFWIELNADGSALTVSTDDRNKDNKLSSDEFILMPGYWQLNAAGEVLIRRYRGNNELGSYGFCKPERWDTTLEDKCVLYNERVWALHSVKGERYFVTNTHEFYRDQWGPRKLNNPPVDKHVLDWVQIDNRSWLKVKTRPTALPVVVQSSKTANATLSSWAPSQSQEHTVPWRWDATMSKATAERLASEVELGSAPDFQ